MAEEEKEIKRASDRRRERSAIHEAKIKEYENEVILEQNKMKRMLNDAMSRQDLEKGATITEETVWGYSLLSGSGKINANYIDPDSTKLPHMD